MNPVLALILIGLEALLLIIGQQMMSVEPSLV